MRMNSLRVAASFIGATFVAATIWVAVPATAASPVTYTVSGNHRNILPSDGSPCFYRSLSECQTPLANTDFVATPTVIIAAGVSVLDLAGLGLAIAALMRNRRR